MSIFEAGGNRLGVPALDTTSTTALLPLGTIVRGYDTVTQQNGEYRYVKFGASLTVGQIVTIDDTNKCVAASSTTHANKGLSVGFVLAATAADADYGFVQVSGKAKAKAATVVAAAAVWLTTTAGTVDDAAIAGSQVMGAKFETADGTPAAGFAYVQINRPVAQGQIT